MKKMFVVLAVLILSIGFIGCGGGGDSPGPVGGGVTIPSEYHGTWYDDGGSMINSNGYDIDNNLDLTAVIDATTVKVRNDAWTDPDRWMTYTNFISSYQDGNYTVYVTSSYEVRLGGGTNLSIDVNDSGPLAIVYGIFSKIRVVEEGTILPEELRGTLWKNEDGTAAVKISADGKINWRGSLDKVLAEDSDYRYYVGNYRKYSDGSYWYSPFRYETVEISGNKLTWYINPNGFVRTFEYTKAE